MAVKDQVLEALEAGRGEYRSGEALAEELCVSRNAIWKAVGQLRKQGHEIAASTEGYCLAAKSNVLSPQSIAPYLRPKNLRLEVRRQISSTNAVLRQMAEEGAPEGSVLLAEEQNAGSGRRGRPFYSPPGGGLYMSLLLRPTFSSQEALLVTTCAAVAVCRAVEKLCGVAASIKWVNDVFVGGKKVCGISTEASVDLEGGGLRYAVLGIGLNLFAPRGGFPPELAAVAGSVLEGEPSGALRSQMAGEILSLFWEEYPRLTQRRYFDDYRSRCFLLGQPIHILQGDKSRKALALDLDRDFGLLVRHADGREEVLSSGEVSARGVTGPEGA